MSNHAVPPPSQSQLGMVHRLPPARVVDRLEYLIDIAGSGRVIHVGFVDAGYEEMQHATGSWLHEHLSRRASSLVGLDVDKNGVETARTLGYECYAVDCTSSEAVQALGLEPAEVVIAGEVIEHVDDPGLFLDALHGLVADSGVLVLTTPNASGIINGLAAIAGYELNHPDHVNRFTWLTLTNLLRNHGFEPTEAYTFIPRVKPIPGANTRMRLLALGARMVLSIEAALGRLGRPWASDGLIVTARRADR